MRASRLVSVVGCLLVAGGCAYYNALWRANRMADEAERAQREGRRGEARLLWEQAALKAESVAIKHPTSKWTDDALALEGRALARLDRCGDAIEPLERAFALAPEGAARARAGALLAQCAVLEGDAWRAHEVATHVFAFDQRFPIRDRDVISRAHYWRGQAAVMRDDLRGALDDFRRSTMADARVAETLALLDLGEITVARRQVDSLMQASMPDSTIVRLVVRLGSRDRALASEVLRTILIDNADGAWGRVTLQTAEAALAGADTAWATELFRRALDGPIDSDQRDGVLLALLELGLSDAQVRSDVVIAADRLRPLSNERTDRGNRAMRLVGWIEQILGAEDAAESFLAAEVARDRLGAVHLAAGLFTELADRWPESAFASKALLAVASLRREQRDSLYDYVHSRYPASPYVLALDGVESVAYRFLEDSLMQIERQIDQGLPASSGSRRDIIRVGPRWIPRTPPDSGGAF